MKRYLMRYPEYLKDGTLVNVSHILSEKEILDQYFPYWSKEVLKRYGPDCEHILNERNCIDDWLLINWAQEIKET